MSKKTATTNGDTTRAPRLTPTQLVPIAGIATHDGEFVVRIRTGRQQEFVSAADAMARAVALEAAAADLRRIAAKIEAVTDEAPTHASLD